MEGGGDSGKDWETESGGHAQESFERNGRLSHVVKHGGGSLLMLRNRALLGLRVFSTVRHVMLSQSAQTAVPRSRLTPCLMLPISRAETSCGLTNKMLLGRSEVCQIVERPIEIKTVVATFS